MKIYVAGCSEEIARARKIMEWVRAHPHLDLARDWVADIAEERIKGGRMDVDLSDEEQWQYSSLNTRSVLGSGGLWMLSPGPGNHTTGAWFELGVSVARAMLGEVIGQSFPVVVSGPNCRQYLFTAQAEARFDTDAEAMSWWTARVTPHA